MVSVINGDIGRLQGASDLCGTFLPGHFHCQAAYGRGLPLSKPSKVMAESVRCGVKADVRGDVSGDVRGDVNDTGPAVHDHLRHTTALAGDPWATRSHPVCIATAQLGQGRSRLRWWISASTCRANGQYFTGQTVTRFRQVTVKWSAGVHDYRLILTPLGSQGQARTVAINEFIMRTVS